jgi:putative ABC transport system permease protein
MKKTFVKKGMREIRRGWVQYLFLVVILGIGVSMYGVMSDLGDSRWSTLDSIYEEAAFMDVQVNIVYGKSINETTVNKSTVDSILKRPDISSYIDNIEYRLTYDAYINHSTDKGIKTTRGLVIGYQSFDEEGQQRDFTVNKPLFYVDNPPVFDSADADQCYLERKFSRAYDLGKGDSITVIKGTQQKELKVLEHVNIPEFLFVIEDKGSMPTERSLGIIMMPLDAASELFFGEIPQELEINDIVITLNNSDDINEFQEIIIEEFKNDGIAVKTTGKEENPSRYFLYADLKNDEENLAIFPIMIFSVAALGLIMVLRRMIRVHRSQIGIFKALGIPDRSIIMYFFVIGLFIAVLGIIAGFIISLWLNSAMNSMMNNLYDFAVMSSSVSWNYYIYGSIFSIALCAFCTLIPTWFALRIKPIDAIQNKEDITSQKGKKFKKKVGSRNNLPVPLKLSIRNFTRRPGRSLTSILGVAISLGLFLGIAIVFESVIVALDTTSEDTRLDYEIIMDEFSPVNMTEAWSKDFSALNSEGINPGILQPTEASKGSITEEGIIYGLKDVRSAFKVELEKGNLRTGEVVISTYTAERLGVDVGDKIELEVLQVTESGFALNSVEIQISGLQSNHIGFLMFMDLETLQNLTNLNGYANIIYLNTEKGQMSRELENALITTPHVKSVTYVNDRENVLEQYFDLFLWTIALMLLLSIVMAGAIVYNLFMINAQESRRDYATMKTLGTSLKRLGYLIFIEAGFVIVLGIILGILVGYGMAMGMFANLGEFEVFNIDILIPPLWFTIGIAMIILVILFVSWRTLSYVNKINIADVIRERST